MCAKRVCDVCSKWLACGEAELLVKSSCRGEGFDGSGFQVKAFKAPSLCIIYNHCDNCSGETFAAMGRSGVHGLDFAPAMPEVFQCAATEEVCTFPCSPEFDFGGPQGFKVKSVGALGR